MLFRSLEEGRTAVEVQKKATPPTQAVAAVPPSPAMDPKRGMPRTAPIAAGDCTSEKAARRVVEEEEGLASSALLLRPSLSACLPHLSALPLAAYLPVHRIPSN